MDATSTEDSFQFRVRIDRWMGDLYEALDKLPKGAVRTREALHLMRLGLEASKNPRAWEAVQPVGTAQTASPATKPRQSADKTRAPAPAAQSEPNKVSNVDAEQQALEEVRQFGQSWNLASMLTPPPAQ